MANARTANESAPPLASLKILVVEDTKDMLEVLCKQLTRLGHVATGVGTAEAAMQELNALPLAFGHSVKMEPLARDLQGTVRHIQPDDLFELLVLQQATE